MRLFILSAFVFVSAVANAQILTATGMVETVQCLDFTCADSYFTSKGFTFYFNEERDTVAMVAYVAAAGSTTPGNLAMFDKGLKMNTLTFTTAIENDNNMLLNGFKSLGFIESGITTTGYGNEYAYQSAAYPYHNLRYFSGYSEMGAMVHYFFLEYHR